VGIPEGESKSGNLYVDINLLYTLIITEPPFNTFSDPIATYIGIMSLMGNDYIKHFAPGLTTGTDTVHNVPWFVLPLINNPAPYKSMIKIVPASPGLPGLVHANVEAAKSSDYSAAHHGKSDNDQKRKLEEYIKEELMEYRAIIDEKTFVQYTHECYYYKYKDVKAVQKAVAKRLTELAKKTSTKGGPKKSQTTAPQFPDCGDLEDIDFSSYGKGAQQRVIEEAERERNRVRSEIPVYVECIREHLSRSKNNAMMPNEEIIAFSRRVRWLLMYWTNSYIGDCKYPNPCETYKGKSYYGWKRGDDNYHACHATNSVSKEKPNRSWEYNENPFSSQFDNALRDSESIEDEDELEVVSNPSKEKSNASERKKVTFAPTKTPRTLTDKYTGYEKPMVNNTTSTTSTKSLKSILDVLRDGDSDEEYPDDDDVPCVKLATKTTTTTTMTTQKSANAIVDVRSSKKRKEPGTKTAPSAPKRPRTTK
jgi:hypothetical protein